MSTPHGRLQYARGRKGYSQAEFSELMGYRTPSGWSKIELGERLLTYDHILKANEILKLDERYYFGKITYDEAESGDLSRFDDVVKEMRDLKNKVIPVENIDPVAERVMANQTLRKLVEMVQFLDSTLLQRFIDIAYGFITGNDSATENGVSSKKVSSNSA